MIQTFHLNFGIVRISGVFICERLLLPDKIGPTIKRLKQDIASVLTIKVSDLCTHTFSLTQTYMQKHAHRQTGLCQTLSKRRFNYCLLLPGAV